MEFASVQLFVERARAATLDFQITAKRRGGALLCHWLEASRLPSSWRRPRGRADGPARCLEQIADRFDFPGQPAPRHRDRHRTLRAALDWSYRMLLPDLQEFFSRLSVFRGGWTAEAAEAVTGKRTCWTAWNICGTTRSC
jgi:predicted ATPase